MLFTTAVALLAAGPVGCTRLGFNPLARGVDGGAADGRRAEDRGLGQEAGMDSDLSSEGGAGSGDASAADGAPGGWIPARPPVAPLVILQARDSHERDLTTDPAVDVTIRRDQGVVSWCLIEAADDAPAPAAPESTASCFDSAPPRTVTLRALGKRRVHVFVQDAKQRINLTPGSAMIEYVDNRPPRPFDDYYTLAVNSAQLELRVTANDRDRDGDALTVVDLIAPTNGAVQLSDDGLAVLYRPDPDYVGSDSFAYTVRDAGGLERDARVNLRVGDTVRWTGQGADDRWSTADNWQGGVAPTTTDVVLFDSGCGTRCDCTIDGDVTVGGLWLGPAYAGTLTQANGATLSVGGEGWVQMGGTFLGADGPINVGGNAVLAGGSFRATSGDLSIGQRVESNNDGGLKVLGGAFEHNGGTLVFNGSKGGDLYNIVATIDVDRRLGLHNLRLNLRDSDTGSGENGAALRIRAGDTLEIRGDLSLRDGKMLGGACELHGDVSVEYVSYGVKGEGGTTPIIIRGDGRQYYRGQYPATAPRLVMDTHGSLEPAAFVGSYSMSGLKMVYGRFVSPRGTFRFHYDYEYGLPEHTRELGLLLGGGEYVDQSAGYAIDVWVGHDHSDEDFRIHSPTPLSLASLRVDLDDYNSRGGFDQRYIRLTPETELRIEGSLDITNGRLEGGLIRVGGDVRLGCLNSRTCSGGGSTPLILDGAQDQRVTQSATSPGAAVSGGVLTIAKPAGSVLLQSDLFLARSGQSLTLSAGTLDAQGRSIDVAGSLTLEAGTEITMGGGTLSYDALTNNGGTITP